MKQYSINVSKEAFLRFLVINNSRPQDENRAQTFEHILSFYEDRKINSFQSVREKQLAPTKNNEFIQLGGIKS